MIEKIIKHKNLFLPAIAVILAAILFSSSALSDQSASTQTDKYTTEYSSDELKTYTEQMEERIKLFLSDIKGISKVSVILTIESSSETVYATQGNNADYVLIKDSKGNENAIPLTEISAKIRGIAVVCDYGGDERLKMTVIDLLSALFDVGTNRVTVLPA